MDSPLNCQSFRRFGVEIEVNTSDGVVRRIDPSGRDIPLGADKVAQIVSRISKEKVQLIGWEHVHNNRDWIIKPDSSCGIEINSPVLKGWLGLEKLLKVIDGLRDNHIKSDERCSLHVHVNIADLTSRQLASVIAHYIKCEHVFFDSVPPHRKNNRYCQLIGMTDLFDHNFGMDSMELIRKVSLTKYCSINAYHFVRGGGFSEENVRKRTLEFRIMEGTACLDSWLAKNWIRLILHFVDVTKDRPLPPPYEEGNPWSSLLWLNPKDVFSLLRFDGELSEGLQQVRQWFLGRLMMHGRGTGLGIWSKEGRAASWAEITELDKELNSNFGELPVPLEERTYGRKYIL